MKLYHGEDHWLPNSEPQRVFLGLPYTIKEALYGGAAGGGKTEALIFYPIVSKIFVQEKPVHFYEHPSFKGIIFRRTFPQLEQELIPRAREVYEELFGAKYNESKHYFKFPSGAMMYMSYLDRASDALDHDSAQYNLIMFEELTHFDEYLYTRLISRLRSSSTLPSIIRSASNPGNIGHTWVKNRFVTPDRLGRKILIDPKVPNWSRIFIPAVAKDNIHLIRNNPHYVEQLKLLPDAEAKALIDGDWDAFQGQVFTEFRTHGPLPNEPETANHVIDSFPIPYWWPKVLAIDWGFKHYTAVVWLAISPEGRVYVYRELMVAKQYITTWTADVKRAMQYDGNILDIVIDPSSNQQRGDPKTIKQQVVEALEYPVADADNDRIGGKNNIHEYLRFTPRPPSFIPSEGFDEEAADRVLRMYGLDAYKQYCVSFLPKGPETNLPRLQIFSDCIETIKCIQNASADEKRVEDVLKYNGDDMYDAFRYGLKRVHLYFNQADSNEKTFGRLEKIQERFQKSLDYNVLAGELRKYNEDIHSQVAGVRHGKGFRTRPAVFN